MPIEVTLERRQLQLTCIEGALAKGATSRHALRRQFESAIAALPLIAIKPPPSPSSSH
ncbi:hypothetical protein JOY44_27065 (plasmid) [Phormidium sp. CLA17]|uniref:hypothetical protein n=1 Tax=Leptolyngbya sp. Cla-17 TaxID=2803751 RepID=UPI001490E657|nr:hypothetical protein [Leptolyngbya sp. Cla-17]MBM0744761.1 hypothetical protein [Leptolyngbya sp. Cla-17]MBM0745124.1 hypothetical protein [Leptolyngbya sp. Cla-17]MBM0745148.1 hypothetical protein [Leptolyngbya sp. Cla-17]